ncbi:MAG: hypothetical protein JWM27_222 [Gemmatimonadetes bacterium]|nr:hypothetical protein [Gemmatimonadota bacterium]
MEVKGIVERPKAAGEVLTPAVEVAPAVLEVRIREMEARLGKKLICPFTVPCRMGILV